MGSPKFLTQMQDNYKLMEAPPITETEDNDQNQIQKQEDKGCAQAFKDQAMRFCSPHTAVPEEWGEGKRMPLLYGPYGLSSFTYSILGLWILIFVRDNHVLGTPFYIDGTLLFVQGIVSYGCDVYTFGFSSIFKILDRCSALVQGIWWIAKLIYVSMSIAEYFVFIGFAMIAIVCKFKGEVSMRNLQWNQFLIWHSLWHFFVPIGLFIWAFLRNNN